MEEVVINKRERRGNMNFSRKTKIELLIGNIIVIIILIFFVIKLAGQNNYNKDFKENIGMELSHNYITNLEPLRNLRNLKKLNLSKNQIRDLSPLCSMVNLEKLDLW